MLFTCLESFLFSDFFFSFQFCQQIKLWEEVFRKPTLEGGTGLLSCRVCFLQDFSLLTQAVLLLLSFPAIPFPHCFTTVFLFFALSTSQQHVFPSHFCLSLPLFNQFLILSTVALVISPFSPFHFLPSRISQASHNEEQIGFLTRLIGEKHHVDARLS